MSQPMMCVCLCEMKPIAMNWIEVAKSVYMLSYLIASYLLASNLYIT